ncbi:hypothetical protein [Nitrincola iocasae]|jgi:hypothetical protein|uniref:Uncharacterized protein n=1 Tax=Nitrincola iocasae TaxID=2614693 RepID=A0A5J6LBY5_9GAMM|nr:hypothetical protein [Nitrincola iocasae]QEW06043.1 hypothetical protein F5I99_05780 [Nitrincola iocasae]
MKIDLDQVKAYRVLHPDTSMRVNKTTPSGGFGDLLERLLHQPSSSNTQASVGLSEEETESKTSTETEVTAEQQREAVRNQLLAMLDMTPAERIRFAYLQSKGLTEEDLANMSPEEREKIEQEIQDELENKLGGVADSEDENTTG